MNRDFEPGVVVVARQADLSISDTGVTTGISHRANFRVYRECSEKRKFPVSGNCEEKIASLVAGVRGKGTDWLETVEKQQSQITTSYK